LRVVVDTNVVAYYLLGTAEFVEETGDFWNRTSITLAPSLWEAEIANVIWLAVRHGSLSHSEAEFKLRSAAGLGIQSLPTRALWQGALLRSLRSDVAVYDTLFVELAARERLPLATYDRKLLERFPETAARPRHIGTG
jgi:predicted nucleic acid-binding protein